MTPIEIRKQIFLVLGKYSTVKNKIKTLEREINVLAHMLREERRKEEGNGNMSNTK